MDLKLGTTSKAVWLIVASILIVGCGQAGTAAKAHTGKPSPSQSQSPTPTSTATGTAPAGPARLCMAALGPQGVPSDTLSWISDAVTTGPHWPRITLAATLTGGPVSDAGAQSSIQTAYLNLLSSAVGYPLQPYLGQTVTEVNVSGGTGDLSGYTCLEDGSKVVGMWGQQNPYTAQPEFLVTAKDETLQSLTGVNFLDWLEKEGYYWPRAVSNSPDLTAVQALENYFAVLSDPSLSPAQSASLQATYTVATPGQGPGSSPFLALVPIEIRPWTPPGASGSQDVTTQQKFGVNLWPLFRTAITPDEMAGNGWQYMFYVMVRPTGATLWKIESVGTGP